MKRKEVLTGLIVLVILITAVLLIKKSLNKKAVMYPSATPSIEQKFVQNFPGLTIPDDVERIELKDVSGGEGFGIATKTEILVNLPDLEAGQYYQVWLEKDDKSVLLGKMRVAKGGWLLEYNAANYPGYNKVIVTLSDKHLLEGSF